MSFSPEQDQLLDLCGKVRDGTISEAELRRLEGWLLTDSAVMSFYCRFMAVCSGLEQLSAEDELLSGQSQLEIGSPGISEPPFLKDDWAKSIPADELSGEIHSTRPLMVTSYQRRYHRISLIVSAGLFLAAVLVLTFIRVEQPQEQETANGWAMLVEVSQAEWLESNPPRPGMPLKDDEYTLVSGAALIRFTSGAELLVQAPSRFTIRDQAGLELQTGSLVMTLPPEARGFQVRTSVGTVTDLGTRVGVMFSPETGLEVHVFEGRAEVLRADGSEQNVLNAGQAVAILSGAAATERLDAVPDFFAESIDQLRGLPVVTGDVELLVSPPRSVRRFRSELVDIGRATVFAESTGVPLGEAIQVTLTDPNQSASMNSRQAVLQTSHKLDSYLIHFAVPRRKRRTAESLAVNGSLTFDRPIVAVATAEMRKLQSLFGHPATEYAGDNNTGLEDDVAGNSAYGDSVTISPDRRTLTFHLHLHGREAFDSEDFVDQLRVLVESP